jgi:hypothetical protein
MRRAAACLIVVISVLGAAACADSTAPAPVARKAPGGSVNTRYILASGDVPPPGCRDLGNGYWLCDDAADPALAKPSVPSKAPTTTPGN